jgi:hypothetical protein
LKESRENDEHPARLAPVTAIAMTRRMIDHSDLRPIGHNPQWQTVGVREQNCNQCGQKIAKEWLTPNLSVSNTSKKSDG